MVDSFTLQISVEGPYRDLAPEVATRYAELAGGSSADGAAFGASLASAIDRLVSGAGPEDHLEMAFVPGDAGVHVDLSCNGRKETVTVKITVAKH